MEEAGGVEPELPEDDNGKQPLPALVTPQLSGLEGKEDVVWLVEDQVDAQINDHLKELNMRDEATTLDMTKLSIASPVKKKKKHSPALAMPAPKSVFCPSPPHDHVYK